jgi:hypothetical protein
LQAVEIVALRKVWEEGKTTRITRREEEKATGITSKRPSRQQDIVNNLAVTYKSVQARTQSISSSIGNQFSLETTSGRDICILNENEGDSQSLEDMCDDNAF